MIELNYPLQASFARLQGGRNQQRRQAVPDHHNQLLRQPALLWNQLQKEL